MPYRRTTLSKFIIEEQRRLACGAELIALVNDIQTACKYIASAVAKGTLTGTRGGTGAMKSTSPASSAATRVAGSLIGVSTMRSTLPGEDLSQ